MCFRTFMAYVRSSEIYTLKQLEVPLKSKGNSPFLVINPGNDGHSLQSDGHLLPGKTGWKQDSRGSLILYLKCMPDLGPYESPSLTDIFSYPLCGTMPSRPGDPGTEVLANSQMRPTIMQAAGEHSSMPSRIGTRQNWNRLSLIPQSFRTRALQPASTDLSETARSTHGRYLSAKGGLEQHTLALPKKATVHASLLEECQLHHAHELWDEVGSFHLHLVWALTRGKQQARIEAMLKHPVTILQLSMPPT